MADNEDDLVVQVDEERRDDDQANDPVAQFKLQLDALKKDNEKRQASEAAANRQAASDRAAAEAARIEAQGVRADLAARENDTVEASIKAAQAEAEAAEKDYAAAAEAGDFKKQAEAQRKIARAEAKIERYETTKAELALRKSTAEHEPVAARRVSSDPFEDHLKQFTPRTQSWMREHREWVIDQRKSLGLGWAHNQAVDAGLQPDTDEYFAHVERTLGIGQDEAAPTRNNGADNGQQQRSQRRATPAVAPVNGGAGGHSSGSGNNRGGPSVTLSKGEVERSEDGSIVWNRGNTDPKTGETIKDGDPRIGKPIGRQEYARRKLALEKGGYYDKMYSHG